MKSGAGHRIFRVPVCTPGMIGISSFRSAARCFTPRDHAEAHQCLRLPRFEALPVQMAGDADTSHNTTGHRPQCRSSQCTLQRTTRLDYRVFYQTFAPHHNESSTKRHEAGVSTRTQFLLPSLYHQPGPASIKMARNKRPPRFDAL